MLCKYRNIIGEPGKGIHFHILGIAVMDLLLTLGIATVLWKWRGWNFFLVLFLLLIITILTHRLFCVNSTFNKLIFGNV